MTGTNHALTGAVIVSVAPNPWIGLPLAFMSHFVLDALPHFGEVYGKRKRLSKSVWTVDVSLVFGFLLVLIFSHRWSMFTGALFAVSPDFAWIYRFVWQEKFGRKPAGPTNAFNSWHANIQKFESRYGLLVEMVWLLIFSATLWSVK